MTRQPSGLLTIAPEVERALIRSEAVVALESSLVAHGLPADIGPGVARESERRVREAGAIPATIAVIDGTVHVGLEDGHLDRLAHGEVRKLGPRDLAAGVISGGCGGTTVAGTLAVCQIAGIHFMATGGIGGAHRGWQETGDISADLQELARAAVCVVCSGAKSLLDVPATLEMLESLGVPVVGFGTDYFPLFYVRESRHVLVDRVDDPVTAAAVAGAHWGFARTTGLVVAQPVAEEVALEAAEVESLVEGAVQDAARVGVRGPNVTPYVLGRLHAGTDGRTLQTNARLVCDNAALAAQIAVAYYA
ncbi:MAG: pseudouridine-5'-phosphate glycosidase [Gaiellales bacterium]